MHILLTQVFAASLNPLLLILCAFLGYLISDTFALKRNGLILILVSCLAMGSVVGLIYGKVSLKRQAEIYDRFAPFDPSYRLWDDIQGTKYEQFSELFVAARNEKEAARMKGWIDRKEADCRVLLQAHIIGDSSSNWARDCNNQSMLAKGLAAVFLLLAFALFFRSRR